MRLRLLVELLPVLVAALLAWRLAGSPRIWSLPTRALRRFARTPRQAILWSAALSFAVCPIFSWVRPPSPEVHDEFSYLLAADTFAHGRLTNPTPPLWRHFESFHINLQPTYQSKYPPGQGLFLAAGQVLAGRPIVGVWLSVAAGAAAICWMLLAWMPPRWALFGALLPAFRFGTLPVWDDFWFAYWNTTFWGGAVAMAGGALFFGALPRLMRRQRARDAVWLAAGLIVLANTRPFEGLVAALPVAIILAAWAATQLQRWNAVVSQIILPAAGVLLIGVLAMGYYNYRGTGDPLKMPYLANSEQYEVVPLFVFQAEKPGKAYNHDVFREYHYEYMMEGYERKRAGFGVPTRDLTLAADFFWGYVLWVALAFVPGRFTRWVAFGVALSILSVLSNAVSSSERLHMHYLAPFVPWFVFLAVWGVRQMRLFRVAGIGKGHRVGRTMAEAAISVCLLSFIPSVLLLAKYGHPSSVRDQRSAITARLELEHGDDLVIVSYSPQHDVHKEWVYNVADFQTAPIVWARDMGPQKNRELIARYPTRQVWRLYPDENPPQLHRYKRVRRMLE